MSNKNLLKVVRMKNHTQNIVSTMQLNKKTTPHLFNLIRLSVVALNTLPFCAESFEQLNSRRLNNA